jgi:hypothetical protein
MTTPTRERTLEDVARARYAEQVAIGVAAARAAGNAWADLDLADVRNSWIRLIGVRLLRQIEAAQLLVARTAHDYVDRAVAASRRRPARRVRVIPERLVGVASDGRPLPTLLYQPAFTTLRAIEAGKPAREAAALGGTQLDMIVRTTIADTGRTATGIEVAATPTLGYVRMLNPPSCSRCAILAGRFYRWNAGFQRHPRCDCIHVPVTEDAADDLRTDPQQYFDSLSEAEQRRVFTVAGAEAIRDGADIARVVNARRGMYVAGGRRFTREGTRRRGARAARLMPEQIYREAAGNRAEAIRLLRLHGYIT